MNIFTLTKLPETLIPGLTVTVRNEGDQTLSVIYSKTAPDTYAPLANPFQVDANGDLRFYANTGWYEVTLGGTGSQVDNSWNGGLPHTFPAVRLENGPNTTTSVTKYSNQISSPFSIDTIDTSMYSSKRYKIMVKDITSGEEYRSSLEVVFDGTNTYYREYDILTSMAPSTIPTVMITETLPTIDVSVSVFSTPFNITITKTF